MSSPKRQLDVYEVEGPFNVPGTQSDTPGFSSPPKAKRARLQGNDDTASAKSLPDIPQGSELASTPQTTAELAGGGEEARNRRKPKGQVRFNVAGELEHYLESTETWEAAMYHQDIRAELIEEASRHGAYDHPRDRGLGDTDITSFIPLQKSWGEKREHWPDVLFTLDVKKVRKNTNLPKAPLWYRKGRLVLDQDDNPMRYFPDTLPATCSSQIKEWLLVAICHSDFRIRIDDIRARMPKEFTVDKRGTIKLFGTNTISMRMSRFRLQAALMPREMRSGSKVVEEELKKIIGQQCIDENSTRPFGRLLTEAEMKQVRQPNKGKFSQKSRSKKGSIAEVSKKRKRGDDGDESDADDNLLSRPQEINVHASRSKKARYNDPLETGLPTPALSASSYLTPQVHPTQLQESHTGESSPQPWYTQYAVPGSQDALSAMRSAMLASQLGSNAVFAIDVESYGQTSPTMRSYLPQITTDRSRGDELLERQVRQHLEDESYTFQYEADDTGLLGHKPQEQLVPEIDTSALAGPLINEGLPSHGVESQPMQAASSTADPSNDDDFLSNDDFSFFSYE